MELRHLRYFVTAAEELNVSRAAARLHVSQPAVSRQIKDLEVEFGLPLFNREPNGLSLTDAGQTALAHAREVLRQSAALGEAMQCLASRDSAEIIKVGFIPTALPGFLAEGMRQFNRKYRNAMVQIFEMPPIELKNSLHDGTIDLALIGDPGPELKRQFNVTVIRKVEIAMAVPDDHPLAHRKSVDLSEFGDDNFVTLHEKWFPDRPDMAGQMFSRANISPLVAMHANGLSELLGLVGSGAGVAMTPADLVDLPHSGVVFIKLNKPKLTLQFSAAWRNTGDLSKIEALVDLMKAGER